MKDLAITGILIYCAWWLLTTTEGAPPVSVPVFSFQILVIPAFLAGMYFCFSGKRMLLGIGIMFAVAWYLFGGVA